MKSAPQAHRLLVVMSYKSKTKNIAESRKRTKKRNWRQKSCQTKEELTLGVPQQAISHHLRSLEIIQNQGNLVPGKLKSRNVEGRLCICELLMVIIERVFSIV